MNYILLNVISINQMVCLRLRHITNEFHENLFVKILLSTLYFTELMWCFLVAQVLCIY